MNPAEVVLSEEQREAAHVSFEAATEPYAPRSIRRSRREMDRLREGLVHILTNEHPTTVRHAFYVAVSRGLVEKTEAEYKGTIVRLLTQLRRSGEIPFEWIADNTRWVLRSRTYRSREEALAHVARTYRRNLWDGRDVRVEVWAEKDAIASLLVEAADEWCVPVMAFRGYSSISYLYTLAEEIREDGRPTHIYYFGDHDPSGLDIERFVARTVRELAPEAELHVTRAAVTPEQIEKYGLPERPTKDTDSRSKHFSGGSVDVDAISPRVLADLTTGYIVQHLDLAQVERLRRIEEEERRTLAEMAAHFGGAA